MVANCTKTGSFHWLILSGENVMKDNEKKRLILVVDDHPRVLRFIEIDLKLRGFQVITTTSGKEALGLVRSEAPDIMLLDVVMPETDGFEVLKQLRTFSQLPVIAFSASPGSHDDAVRLGANAFVTKPFHTDDMVRRINAIIGE
jgi:two-component system KDP operon response regulator KdpE